MAEGRLADKVVLISGGASGIGFATAVRCAQAGATVVIGDLDDEKAQAAAAAHAALHALHLDVTDEAGWDEITAEVLRRFGRLDVLVNSAGIALNADIEHETLAQFRRVMAVNVEGVFLGCRAGVRAMRSHGGSGLVGGHNLAAYNASKGAVRLLTKSVALYCARKGYGIRCNSVHPTFVDTPMLRGLFTGRSEEEVARVQGALRAQVPLGRVAQPEEIADMIVYLASDESSFVTGAEFVIDGGLTAC